MELFPWLHVGLLVLLGQPLGADLGEEVVVVVDVVGRHFERSRWEIDSMKWMLRSGYLRVTVLWVDSW